eukprot:TRINITY_DN576_c0_g2_i1.p1 TRINITY_DN576_c0_g2~~TRINITY_DN576_c0_g2_i1.p1  ORF type:complete len:2102 (+),score=699.65 TRINITY_DN576_c0_g2_i1:116-6421(+)
MERKMVIGSDDESDPEDMLDSIRVPLRNPVQNETPQNYQQNQQMGNEAKPTQKKLTIRISSKPTVAESKQREAEERSENDSYDSDDQKDDQGLEDWNRTETDFIPEKNVIEKILAYRTKKPEEEQEEDNFGLSKEPEYEFLIKWKGLSYLHTEWISRRRLNSITKQGETRIKKFFQKRPPINPDEPFSPNFTEIERIISSSFYNGKWYYLVKWEGLQYGESTWEMEDVINDDEQIESYRRRNMIPEDATLPTPPKPPSSEWKKMTEPFKYKGELELRPYQLEGLNWLVYCWYHRINSILADEMGLGKTVQSVSIIDYLHRIQKIRGPFLIIVPLSTMLNWQREFERWTDLNVVVYHGTKESRNIIDTYEWFFEDGMGGFNTSGPFKFNVIITTYEMLITSTKLFRSIEWKYCIVDEAHRLKNKDSKLTIELKKLRYDHLTLLTGTPIQNSLDELWTLLHILDPEKFRRLEDFQEEYGDFKDSSSVQQLQATLRTYLLRRMKEDVEKSLAPKEETIIEVELTTTQKKYYRSILERNFENLVKGGKANNLPSLMNVMMQLRKCCNHPYLLDGVEDNELIGKDRASNDVVYKALIEASGKLILVDKLLPKLKEEHHKVLIFSQMIRVLDILSDYLHYRGYKHERIDGNVRGNDRQAAIDRFSRPDSNTDVFLLCTRAGGLGINLTAADTVIIYDSDWNPQNDLQAQARCHRIGQEKLVKIYRLLTRNTYERLMFERASKKLGLDQAVLTQMDDSGKDDPDKASKTFTSQEVDLLLKKGAYEAFLDDNDASQAFCDENIDQILTRRTQKVVHDGGSDDGPRQLSSTFAKASFASEKTQPDLDVNDPDFWAKFFPDQAAVHDSMNMDEPGTVRKRKSHRYDGEDDSAAESEDEYEATSSNIKPKSEWTVNLRNFFQKGLLLYGYGRWTKIKQAKNLKPSIDSISRYAESYIKKLSEYLKLPLPKLLEHIAIPDEAEDMNKAKITIKNLIPIARPGVIFGIHPALNQPPPSITTAVPSITTISTTTSTTTATTTTPVQNPPPTEVSNTTESKPTESTQANTTSTTTDASTSTSTTTTTPTGKSFDDDPTLTDPSFLSKMEKNASTYYGRMQALAHLSKFVRTNFEELDGEWPDMNSSSGGAECPEWWGQKEDKDLLLGVHKHGFGRYEEIGKDQTLCYFGRVNIVQKKKSKKSKKTEAAANEELFDWPASKWLALRFRQVLAKIQALKAEVIKNREKQEKKKAKAAAKAEKKRLAALKKAEKKEKKKKEEKEKKKKEKEKEKKKGEKDKEKKKSKKSDKEKKKKKSKYDSDSDVSDSEDFHGSENQEDYHHQVNIRQTVPYNPASEVWTDEELHDLYDAIMIYGIPWDQERRTHDFNSMKSLAKITTKSVNAIQMNCEEFIKMSKSMYTKPDTAYIEKTFHLNSEQVRSVATRIMMFTHIRRNILIHPDSYLNQVLQKIAQIPLSETIGMPEWWIPVKHDIDLIKGVNKLGYGNWYEIVTNPSFAVSEDTSKYLRAKRFKLAETGSGEKKSNYELLNLPQDHIFYARIHKIIKICVDPNNRPPPSQHQPLSQPIQGQQSSSSSSSLPLKLTLKVGSQPTKSDPTIKSEPSSSTTTSSSSSSSSKKKVKEEKTSRKRKKRDYDTSEDGDESLSSDESSFESKPKKKKKKSSEKKKSSKDKDLSDMEEDDEKPKKKEKKKKEKDTQDKEKPTKGKKRKREEDEGDTSEAAGPPKKRKKRYEVKRGENGEIVFPLVLSTVISIENLGKINTGDAFNNKQYIYPVGFKSRREYMSTLDPSKRCVYICEILNQDNSPKFKITPEDDPENFVVSDSAASSWKVIMERINSKKQEKRTTSISGPEYYGFGISEVKDLISQLPDANLCVKFFGGTTSKKKGSTTPSSSSATKKKKKSESSTPTSEKKYPPLKVQPVPVSEKPPSIDMDDLDDDDDEELVISKPNTVTNPPITVTTSTSYLPQLHQHPQIPQHPHQPQHQPQAQHQHPHQPQPQHQPQHQHQPQAQPQHQPQPQIPQLQPMTQSHPSPLVAISTTTPKNPHPPSGKKPATIEQQQQMSKLIQPNYGSHPQSVPRLDQSSGEEESSSDNDSSLSSSG